MQIRPVLFLLFALSACQYQSEKVVYHSIRDPMYDTVFQPAYIAKAQPAIFEKAFSAETRDTAGSHTVTFSAKQLGAIRIESGKIIACDPIEVHDAPPFGAIFPQGSFPVQVAIAHYQRDERIAFSRIMFSDKPVYTWTMAGPAGHKPLSVFDSTFYGYPVDGGIGMFIDSLAQRSLNSLIDQDNGLWETIFNREMDKHSQVSWTYVVYPFQGHNLAAFSSGLGDGRYGSYIGYDSAGNICRLLTDFNLVDWFHHLPQVK